MCRGGQLERLDRKIFMQDVTAHHELLQYIRLRFSYSCIRQAVWASLHYLSVSTCRHVFLWACRYARAAEGASCLAPEVPNNNNLRLHNVTGSETYLADPPAERRRMSDVFTR